MNTRLKKIGMGLVLVALPWMASTVEAQWNSQQQYTSQGQYVPPVQDSGQYPGQYLSGNSVIATPANVPVYGTNEMVSAEKQSAYRVGLDRDGRLSGRIASIDSNTKTPMGLAGLNVFFVRQGQVIKQTQTTSDGSFDIQGMQPGPYSFFAAGKSGFAAYGVYVLGYSEESTTSPLQVTAASLNYYGIQQLLQHNVPKQVAQSVVSAIQYQSPGAEIESAQQIRLIKGRLTGQISVMPGFAQDVNAVHVHLVQDGQPIAQVQTDSQGQFSVPDLEPGVYDFVAANETGFSAGRFEAVGNSNSNPMMQVSYRKIATKLQTSLTAPGQIVDPADANQNGPDFIVEPTYSDSYSAPIEYSGESIMYGGASGSTGAVYGDYSGFNGGGVVQGRFGGGRFGRFGGGGGGGLGRLLMLGGLTGGIIAIADDDPGASSPVNN